MLISLIIGCDYNRLAQSWQIDRTRILAVAAEPAEPRPGDVVTFTSLVVSPASPIALTTWFACLPDAADSYGCTVDPTALDGLQGLDPSTLSDEELAALYAELTEAGLIGVDPIFSPVWTVPADALDGLEPEQRNEGINAIISVAAVPEGADMTDADVELAYKRVPVSEALTPNHNPVVDGFTVDGLEVAPGSVVELDAGQPYTIGIRLHAGSIERYEYITTTGESEDRDEEPYVSWYLQEGTFNLTNTLYPTLETTYSVPSEPTMESGALWAVVRDRRGGMAWMELPIRYVDPA